MTGLRPLCSLKSMVYISGMMHSLGFLMKTFAMLLALCAGSNVFAQAASTPTIPNFWDPQERFIKPNLKGMQRMRFLTVTDFPPFSSIDADKRLVGFHVDLARAICEELELLSVCQIQALPLGELEAAVTGGQGDLVLAGLKVTPETRGRLSFSRPYFKLPARFVTKVPSDLSEPLVENLKAKSVAVVDGTAHAAYARANFGDMQVRLFETRDSALAALEKGEVAAVFDDGLALAFWLQRQENLSQQNKKPLCCGFIGGPYLSDAYFGSGLTVGMAPGNQELEDAVNYALRSINEKGRFAELYLRYFPVGLF